MRSTFVVYKYLPWKEAHPASFLFDDSWGDDQVYQTPSAVLSHQIFLSDDGLV